MENTNSEYIKYLLDGEIIQYLRNEMRIVSVSLSRVKKKLLAGIEFLWREQKVTGKVRVVELQSNTGKLMVIMILVPVFDHAECA